MPVRITISPANPARPGKPERRERGDAERAGQARIVPAQTAEARAANASPRAPRRSRAIEEQRRREEPVRDRCTRARRQARADCRRRSRSRSGRDARARNTRRCASHRSARARRPRRRPARSRRATMSTPAYCVHVIRQERQRDGDEAVEPGLRLHRARRPRPSAAGSSAYTSRHPGVQRPDRRLHQERERETGEDPRRPRARRECTSLRPITSVEP